MSRRRSRAHFSSAAGSRGLSPQKAWAPGWALPQAYMVHPGTTAPPPGEGDRGGRRVSCLHRLDCGQVCGVLLLGSS